MIKKVLLAILQFLLFVVIFFAASILPPFHIEHVLGHTPDGTRVFVADGLILATALFLLILVIEAVRKRLATAGVWTTVAFLLAVLAGFCAKFGLATLP